MTEPERGTLIQCTACSFRHRYDGGACPVCRGAEFRAVPDWARKNIIEKKGTPPFDFLSSEIAEAWNTGELRIKTEPPNPPKPW